MKGIAPIINYTDVYHHRGLTKDLIKGKVNLEADEIRRNNVRQGIAMRTM